MNRRFLLESLCAIHKVTFAEWYAQFVYETLVPKTVSALPAEYQEVEYIESSGTQYIDTQVKPTTNMSSKIKLSFDALTGIEGSDSQVLGCRVGNVRCYFLYLEAGQYWGYGKGGYFYTNTPFPQINTIYNVETILGSTNQNMIVDGVSIKTSSDSTDISTIDYNLYLFAFNFGGPAQRFSSIKLYYCEIYDNGTLVRNFIPCYRKSDDVIGLYDTVNGVFYTNAGTGTFTKGNDVTATAKDSGKANLIQVNGNGVVDNQLISTPIELEIVLASDDTSSASWWQYPSKIWDVGNANLMISGHKYFGAMSTNLPSGIVSVKNAANAGLITGLFTWSSATMSHCAIWKNTAETIPAGTYKISYMLFDLTLMFGTGNEPTTTDDNRIQEIINRGYMPYNTGSYKVSQVDDIKLNQYNVWDEQWELGTISTVDGQNSAVNNIIRTKNYIKVIPNKAYTMEYSGSISNYTLVWAFCYDENKQLVQQPAGASTSQNAFAFTFGTSFVMPQNCHYIRWYFRAEYGTTYNNDLCLHLTSQRTGYAPHTSYLPSLYQEVEYIESSGTQYIDTQYQTSSTTKVVSKFLIPDDTFANENIFYGQTTYTYNRFCFSYYNTSSTSSYSKGLYFFGSLTSAVVSGDFINQAIESEITKTSIIINGVNYSNSNDTSSSDTLWLFRCGTHYSNNRLYYLKIYDNGTLVRNFIPCYRKTDSVIGLYDMVGGKFYVNAGTGTFTKGSDVKSKTNEIVLPAPLQLGGAINAHDTFEITSSGYVFTKNVGMVDLGSLSWTLMQNQDKHRANVSNIKGKASSYGYMPNILCPKYSTVSVRMDGPSQGDKTISLDYYGTAVVIEDTTYTGSSATDFKTAISGTSLYYQLATPQTITIPKKHLGCVDLGTLSWTLYQDNIFYNTSLFNRTLSENIYCFKYQYESHDSQNWPSMNDKKITCNPNNVNIYIRDTSCANSAELKESLSGVYLFYETDTEVTDFNKSALFEVGGTVTTNEFRYVENQLLNTILSSNGLYNLGTSTYTFDSTEAILEINQSSGSAEKVIKSWNDNFANHKMIYILTAKCSENADLQFWNRLGGFASSSSFTLTTSYATYTQLFTCPSSKYQNGELNLFMGQQGGVIGRKYYFKNAMLIDLTVAFGSGNEPTSVNDSRIQYLLNKGYIPVNLTGTETAKQTETLPNLYLGLQEE